MIKEKCSKDKETISDYMEMTIKEKRILEKTADHCNEQEYEIMSIVHFKRDKSEVHGDDTSSKNDTIYEEYDD